MTTKTALLQTIRKHCLECCGGSYQEVENCISCPTEGPFSSCALWDFRLGKDPEPSESRKLAGKKLAQRNKAKINA